MLRAAMATASYVFCLEMCAKPRGCLGSTTAPWSSPLFVAAAGTSPPTPLATQFCSRSACEISGQKAPANLLCQEVAFFVPSFCDFQNAGGFLFEQCSSTHCNVRISDSMGTRSISQCSQYSPTLRNGKRFVLLLTTSSEASSFADRTVERLLLCEAANIRSPAPLRSNAKLWRSAWLMTVRLPGSRSIRPTAAEPAACNSTPDQVQGLFSFHNSR